MRLMGKMLLLLSRRLMISNRDRSVRQWLILLLTYILLAGGLIFTIEIVLILLGTGDVFIPWTNKIIGQLHHFF
jgi:hypothetical protein